MMTISAEVFMPFKRFYSNVVFVVDVVVVLKA